MSKTKEAYAIEQLQDALKEWEIPEYMHDGLMNYLKHGIEPGSFLMGCLCNDFKQAAGAADSTNQRILYNYAGVMVNGLPVVAQGSPERVAAWIERRGLGGA